MSLDTSTLHRPSGHVYHSSRFVPTAETVRINAAALDVDARISNRVLEAYRAGAVHAGVFSGKRTSGKDTIAREVARHFSSPDQYRVYTVSTFIREELDQVLDLVRDARFPEAGVRGIEKAMNFDEDVARHFVDTLFEEVRRRDVSASERTDLVTMLLIYLADTGRRRRDPEYWTRLCFRRLLEDLAEGRSAYLAGCRYPNEIEPAKNLGIFTTRLIISPEVQLRRIRERDGIEPNLAIVKDPNECALDDYTDFSLMVGNDDDLATTLGVIVNEMEAHAVRLRTI